MQSPTSPRVTNGKPVMRNLVAFEGDEGSTLEMGTVNSQNMGKQFHHGLSAQTLYANSNDGWSACSGNGKDGVKIRIQCHNDSILLPSRRVFLHRSLLTSEARPHEYSHSQIDVKIRPHRGECPDPKSGATLSCPLSSVRLGRTVLEVSRSKR